MENQIVLNTNMATTTKDTKGSNGPVVPTETNTRKLSKRKHKVLKGW